jgi:hypothetical protein
MTLYHKDGTVPRRTTGSIIFVFGSNYAGIHGAGAAKEASNRFGAQWGDCCGLQGNSFAIPTKDRYLKVLPFEKVKENIQDFITFVCSNEAAKYNFWITRVGCGLAGFDDRFIAPIFTRIVNFQNCSFPDLWKKYFEEK